VQKLLEIDDNFLLLFNHKIFIFEEKNVIIIVIKSMIALLQKLTILIKGGM